ncbi:VENN motif pre-toxin domain-containing protein, partial [Acerihabitans sp. TG2]|uniref:VENN motif pre-toxin domain-containing protein n=1 Tax=Acerihabitans sp. TG2 TaxID=3096008 RepID=UPI002B2380BD
MGNVLGGSGGSGHASSHTRAAVSEGTLTVRQVAQQRQELSGLSRDAAGAHQALSPIFDKEKEQQRLQEVKLITDICGQLMDIAGTSAAITAAEAASEAKHRNSAADRQAAREQLATGDNPNQSPTEAQIKQQIYDTAYNLNLSHSALGTGGHYRQALQAAVGVLKVALTGGGISEALAAGGAPYIAEGIKHATGDNDEARYTAHAIAGAVLAHMQGQDALAGGAGALTGELAAAQIMKHAYPGKTVEQLTEGEKHTISTLGTLAAGLAGGLTGNGMGEAIVGAQMGKNA